MLFNDKDRARIAAAIAQAESNTAGEIVVIINTRAHRYAATMLATAVLAAITVPALVALLLLDQEAVAEALAGQHTALGVGVLASMV